jgi:hypothetical protein
MRTTFALTLLFAGFLNPADAQKFDWTAYPEMSKEKTLPLIAASLRNTLTDAGSVTNFMVCYPPVVVKMDKGRPVRWTIMMSVNAKNQYGGYAGNQGEAAVFEEGKPVRTFASGMQLDAKTLAGCERIPDAEIQKLIQQ